MKICYPALAAIFLVGCSSNEVYLDAPCLDAIAQTALSNPITGSLAANYAGPLGLTSSSAAEAPPWRSKQAEFRAADGSMHHFAIESSRWPKAVLIKVLPEQDSQHLQLFVMNRTGSLLAAGEMIDGHLSVLDINREDVLRQFQAESLSWRLTAQASSPSSAMSRSCG